MAGACESQHEATAVAIGRPGHHRPGLCCVVVLSCCRVVDAGPKPTASAPAREERGFHTAHFGPAGDNCGPCELGCAEQNKYTTLHTARAAARITSGTPSRPVARKEITQGYHLRHRDRPGRRACSDWSPGVGPSRCPAASMEGGPPAPFKKAGRAAGAIE